MEGKTKSHLQCFFMDAPLIKLLFITPYTPDNQGVGVSYSSQLLHELSKTCYVDLVYFRYKEDKPYKPVHDNIHVLKSQIISTKQKFMGFLSSPFTFPLFTARKNKELESFLKERINSNKYNFIYFDFSQTFSYAACLNHPNKILMAHDVIAQKYSRMKTYLRPWAIFSERRMLNKGRAVFTFSEKDCELIKSLYKVNSFSTTFFLNLNVLNAYPTMVGNYFVFFGDWGRIENSEALGWFFDNVYNQLSKDISFKIIGGGRMPEVLKQKIVQLSNVEYLGFVDDPYKIIANAKAEIAPLHMGAGVKVKCVEALGAGTPIIGTEVAFEGIGEQYRGAMFMANKPEEFVKIINTFDYPLDRKKHLKKYFIENYNDKQILKYIKGELSHG